MVDLQEIFNPLPKTSSISTFAHILWVKRWRLMWGWLAFGVFFVVLNTIYTPRRNYRAESILRFPNIVTSEDDVMRDEAPWEPKSIVTLFNSYKVLSRTLDDNSLQFRIRTRNVFRRTIFANIQYSKDVPTGRYTFAFQPSHQLEIVFHNPKTGENTIVYRDIPPEDGIVSFSGMKLQISRRLLQIKGGIKVEVEFMSKQIALDDYRKRLSTNVLDSEGTARVNYAVSLKDEDPFLAAEVVNDLVQNFISVFKGTIEEQDTDEISRLENNLDTAREKEKSAQDELVRYYAVNPTLFEIQQTDSYALVAAQTEENLYEDRLDNLKQLLNRTPRAGDSNQLRCSWVDDAVFLLSSYGVLQVNSVQNRLKELEARRSELLSSGWMPAHPRITAMQVEIASLEPDLLKILTACQISWLVKLEAARIQVSKGLQKIVPISTDLEAKRLTMEFEYAEKAVETDQLSLDHVRLTTRGRNHYNINVVDSALAPAYQPSGLNKNPFFFMAVFILGMVPGLIWVVLMQLLRGRIFTRSDVERKLRIRFLSGVFIRPGDKSHESARDYPFARSEIENCFSSTPPLSLIVTSARSGEGNSFFTTDLALSFAREGKRTLLVDAILGREHFEGSNQVRALEESIKSIQKVHLPPEAFSTEGFKRFLTTLHIVYDLLVVDAPAVLDSADALNLMKVVPNVVFLVRSGITSSVDAEEALDKIAARGASVGCVLNGVQDSPAVKNRFAD